MLCEGQSIRATARITGSSKITITKLLVDAGKACTAYHRQHVQGIQAKRVEVDEIWAFNHCKQANVAMAKAAPDFAGDVWTWTAIDADTKLVIGYLVGGQDAEYATGFIADLTRRAVRIWTPRTRTHFTGSGLTVHANVTVTPMRADFSD